MMKPELPKLDPDAAPGECKAEAAIAEALVPIAPTPESAGRLRARLVERARNSRADALGIITVRAGNECWRVLVRGVRVKDLNAGPRTRSVLVELEPGATLPTHRHHEHEECVVLRGDAQLGDLEVHRGDYHLAPAGSRHGRVSSKTGALLYLRGTSIGDGLGIARDLVTAWLPGAGEAPITIRAGEGAWQNLGAGAQRKSLWSEGRDSSALIRLDPGAHFEPAEDEAEEECLLLDGEAFFGDTLLRGGDYRLAPSGSRRRSLTSDVGALLFVRGSAGATGAAAI